ncbi:WD40 domain containing protein [Pyrrhoderma noxium]|uniref:WD40 domain containing protein n=1 Tax=Pyrrhoderma noxium TaxID=2282107 RepID=A0A286UG05_9AGAM|nr:WD40 domain containing protein [Pyrrhoderma noxium]
MILEVEYDQLREIDFAGNYIEREVLDPLFTAFEAFLVELRDRVGEEVAMIRRTQDISSQRYLNLTTVATFLSSVTATTLQITAGDQQSVLSIIMNTMWFTSLVFSTASAVYSLLIMTWSRSPVRQFDSYLSPIPSWLTATLRNGPVFTLIASVVAFSVGLCILAFQTAIQQDHIATAIVSTILAGVHAILLLLISAWFLWEQWRANHLEFWEVTKKTFFIPRLYEIKKHRDRPRNTLWNTKESISRLFSSVLGLRDRTRASSSGSDINTDIEKGLVSEGRIIPAAEMVHPSSDSNESGDERRDVQNNPNPELLQANPPIEVTSLNQIESDSGGDEESVKSALEHPVFQPTLQFSPNGAYSAFTHGNKVTIYDSSQVNLYFPLVQSIEVDDRRPITSITWSERNHLLVHAKRSINVWKTDSSVRSIDFSVHNLYIVDAVSLDSPRFLCLSEGTKGSFVVFNLVAETVEKTCGLYGDDHTLILSEKKDNALLQEDKNKVISNKIENELHTIDLWNVILYLQDLRIPGGTIGFYEKDDELIYGASEYEIVILRPSTSTNKDSLSYKALHIVTSPAFTSEIALPISFSFRPNTVLYMLAYGLSDGRIKVWSIQSNMFFKDGGPGVELITVRDRKGRGEDPRVSKKENISPSCFLGNLRISDEILSNGYNVVEYRYQHVFSIRVLYVVNPECVV